MENPASEKTRVHRYFLIYLFKVHYFIQVRLFPGGRLDYETRRCEKHKGGHQLEHHLVTAVKFSAEDPYGRAVALLDLKSSTVKVI